jgi:hypothetical protein
VDLKCNAVNNSELLGNLEKKSRLKKCTTLRFKAAASRVTLFSFPLIAVYFLTINNQQQKGKSNTFV